jgi:dipeptidyl aminopeptidase/acylaminoacyl peptidase
MTMAVAEMNVAPRSRAGFGRCAAVWIILLAAAGCGDSPVPPAEVSVDLDRLFAAPTAAEIAVVEADWASRLPAASEVQVELTQPFALGSAAMRLDVVSHVVDGVRHYGAVLSPEQPPAGPLPLVLYLHGGDGGVAVEEVVLVAGSTGLDPDGIVWVIPSFRSEPLRLGSRSWNSGGTPSPWDRDVDDTLALLDVAAGLVPAANRECIGSVGFSRGGGVGLLLSARDPRVRATVEFFGPTDFFGPFMRETAEEALVGRLRPLPGLVYLNEAWLQRLRRGAVSYEETRLALLRRSPAWFAGRLGPVQVHHGTADDVVPVSQAHALISAMQAIGRGAPSFQPYLYPGVGHNPFFMAGAPERMARFFGEFMATCGATAVR